MTIVGRLHSWSRRDVDFIRVNLSCLIIKDLILAGYWKKSYCSGTHAVCAHSRTVLYSYI